MDEPKRVAIIDLGSNTSKLILMEYRPDHSYRQVDELRQVVRLAEGMGTSKVMRADAFERGLDALQTFRAYCEAAGVEEIRATATSAVREAENGEAFIELIKERVGLMPQIISGEDEAKFETIAIVNSMSYEDAYVFDIGGGSAELSFIKDRQFDWGDSWPLGALVMTERFLKKDPAKKKEVKALRKFVAEQLGDDLDGFSKDLPLIGMGGTLRNLAKIHKKEQSYPLDLLNDYFIPKDDLEDIVEDLIDKTVEEKRSVSGLKTDRADIITAGGIIALEVLKRSGANGYIIASQGLREGVFYGYLLGEKEPLLEDVRDFSIRNLARHYYDFEAHNEHVKTLALTLFDGLEDLHSYGEPERDLLGAAALIHDIGMAVNYNDHHKHGFYLLLNTELPGFSHREQVILALLVRYHRQGSPADEGLGDVLQEGDMERVNKLASILRLAEYLERSKAQLVTGLECHVSENYVQINVKADEDVSVELRETNLRKDLFAEAFGVEVDIVNL